MYSIDKFGGHKVLEMSGEWLLGEGKTLEDSVEHITVTLVVITNQEDLLH